VRVGTAGSVLNLFIILKRTLERTHLCICCCICSPEAVLYLYVFLEALGVQVVQGALGVQVHLLHLCTKQYNKTEYNITGPVGNRQPAENCTCPREGLGEISKTASLLSFCVQKHSAINSPQSCLLEGQPYRTSQIVGHQCIYPSGLQAD